MLNADHASTDGAPARPRGGALRRWYYHALIRLFMLLQRALSRLSRLALGWRSTRDAPPEGGYTFLVTGTFFSDNWILSHLLPLAMSAACKRIYMVAARPVPALPKVVPIYPPRWMVRLVGASPARQLVLTWKTFRLKPDFVCGFHLLANGLFASTLGRITRAKSLYWSVGGPTEVVDGGVWGENAYFARMETPDRFVERSLIAAVGDCDLVITMGTRAVRFFRERGVKASMEVVPGGIDGRTFSPGGRAPRYDLILVGRLVEIKRVDVFLRAVKLLKEKLPSVSAVIVGDGALRGSLDALCRELGLEDSVTFAGRKSDVGEWLKQARIFVLTSDSEGLSLALMEAMMCGLPAVVSNVGDLADLVEEGVNGHLVSRRSPEEFAERLQELLISPERLEQFSRAARRFASRFDLESTARRWDEILRPGRPDHAVRPLQASPGRGQAVV